MKNLFDPSAVASVKERVNSLRPDSERQWGKMTVSQALAHCAATMEVACGDKTPPRILLGRVIGRLAKPTFLNDTPMRRNSPTDKSFVIKNQPDFVAERERLLGLIDRFAAGGPAGCTKQPHSFFGPMTPVEWATGMYKHLDHHLQQFGV